QEAEQLGGIQRDRSQDEDGFHTLAQDHEEDEEEQPEGRILSGKKAHFAFNVTFKRAAGLHHENDYGDDEKGRRQHDPAFEYVLIPMGAGEQDSDADTAYK